MRVKIDIKSEGSEELSELLKGQKQIMATIAQILAAQQQEKNDLASLVTAVNSLLASFAAGTITPAQAQQILDEANSEDQTIAGLVHSVNQQIGTAPAGGSAPAGG